MIIGDEINKAIEFFRWVKPDVKPFLPKLLLLILIGSTGSLFGVAVAVLSKHMIDYAVAGRLAYAGIVGAIFGITIILSLLGDIVESLLAVRIKEGMSNQIRQRFYKKLLTAQWLPLSSYHSGDLLTRLTSDVGNITNLVVNILPSIIALGVQLTVSFFTLLYYEPKLAVIAFILGPSTVLFSRVWGRKLKKINLKVQESESSYRSNIQETLQNLTICKVYQLEQHNAEKLQGLHSIRMNWILQRNKTTLLAGTIISSGYWAGYLIAFGWGIYQLSNKAITYGTLTAFLTLVQQVQAPFIGLAQTFPQIVISLASAERLKELERIETEELKSTPENNHMPKVDSLGIKLHQVSFSYLAENEKPVLDNVNIEIKPGELVALAGHSGVGKTTLIRILLALVEPTKGQALLVTPMGQEYEVSVTTRNCITYVPQGNTLFSGSIADNLYSGKPEATDIEIEQALKYACAWDFIQELPKGIYTVIGERGHGLSEGQAQRIAIARALLKKAPIIILDESTSALDMETEMKVLKALQDYQNQCTCLLITHRQAALQMCSRVLMIDNGKLVDS